MSILITGGAGYIGSVTIELLLARGEKVVVLDNLSRGHRAAVFPEIPFYQGNVGDRQLLKKIMIEQEIEACLHFAAFAYVGESVSNPSLYFSNNVEQGIALLDALIAAGVRQLVFSSTCATYGEPQQERIDEAHPQQPTNPYGWSKLFMERMMHSYDAAYGLKFIALRYFNAAGATTSRGEDHRPETHLIPLVLAAAQGTIPTVSIFGDDYPTPDGTAIRDYIHVSDLAAAHILALNHLRQGSASECMNLGNGQGYSVRDVIATTRRITGKQIKVTVEPRRAGDPSCLVARANKALRVLAWKPAHPDLAEMISSAWAWLEQNPKGYACA
jgi:UDP-glucose 4-epimerase